jgi:hypothetical protein
MSERGVAGQNQSESPPIAWAVGTRLRPRARTLARISFAWLGVNNSCREPQFQVPMEDASS